MPDSLDFDASLTRLPADGRSPGALTVITRDPGTALALFSGTPGTSWRIVATSTDGRVLAEHTAVSTGDDRCWLFVPPGSLGAVTLSFDGALAATARFTAPTAAGVTPQSAPRLRRFLTGATTEGQPSSRATTAFVEAARRYHGQPWRSP